MTQILNDWGIGDKLYRISTRIMQMTFLDGVSQSPLNPTNVNMRLYDR